MKQKMIDLQGISTNWTKKTGNVPPFGFQDGQDSGFSVSAPQLADSSNFSQNSVHSLPNTFPVLHKEWSKNENDEKTFFICTEVFIIVS